MSNRIWIGIMLLIFGGILFGVGWQERGMAANASAQPEEISLKNLIARGPDGNPNIILTDYVLCENLVYESKNGRWTKVWIPAIPTTDLPPNATKVGRPGNIRALVFSINAGNEAEVEQRCQQPKLRALVTNKIVSLGGQEKKLLEQNYPGTDFARCLIIQEGREPAGSTKLLLMLGGGSVLVLAGLGVLGVTAVQHFRQSAASPKRRRLSPEEEELEGSGPRTTDGGEDEPPRRPQGRPREE
jgi:hypothetical protein